LSWSFILAGSSVRIILQKFLGIDSIVIHLVIGTLAGLGLPLLALRLVDRLGLGGWLALGSWPTRLNRAGAMR
jgi:hypothetical protein